MLRGKSRKKEEIENIINAVSRAHNNGVSLVFHLIGFSKLDLINNYPKCKEILNRYHDLYRFYGRQSNYVARGIVASSDFLLMARRPLRFANAGFPFKVAESMMLGTPMMVNKFSDIDLYLENGMDSIILEGFEEDCIFEGIMKSSKLNSNQLNNLKKNAKLKAIAIFSLTGKSDLLSAL